MANHKFNDYWAVTMFSFTNELLAAQQTTLQLIEQLLNAGLTKHVEVDGPMHFRNYPEPAQAEIQALKDLLAKHQAGISLIGGTADRAISSARMVSSDEVVASVKRQLELAAELGAFGLRMMVGGLSLAELQQVAPLAESLNVRILFELHGVMRAESQLAQDCLNLVRQLGSSHVRLMFDSSLFMTELPKSLLRKLEVLGLSNVDELAEKWASSSLDEFKGWLMPQLDRLPPAFRAFLPTLTSRMGHAQPEDYAEYLPYIESVHLKYWEIDDVEDDSALISYLMKNEYRGYLTSEWGGHEWESLGNYPALEMTSKHRELIERSFNLAH